MKRRLSLLLAAVALAACGALVGTTPSEPDAPSAADASSDAGALAPDARTITDAGGQVGPCEAGTLSCNGICVSGCTTCTDPGGVAMPIECFACSSSQDGPVGSCAYADASTFCLNADYSTAYPGGGAHCNCNNGVVDKCPGANQVCIHQDAGDTDWCITCGEKGLATNGLSCKGSLKCNAGASPPRCE